MSIRRFEISKIPKARIGTLSKAYELIFLQLDLKVNAVTCQLLWLFAAENDGDAILDLHIVWN